MGNTAFAAAAAGGSVDTAVGFPKSREEMYDERFKRLSG